MTFSGTVCAPSTRRPRARMPPRVCRYGPIVCSRDNRAGYARSIALSVPSAALWYGCSSPPTPRACRTIACRSNRAAVCRNNQQRADAERRHLFRQHRFGVLAGSVHDLSEPTDPLRQRQLPEQISRQALGKPWPLRVCFSPTSRSSSDVTPTTCGHSSSSARAATGCASMKSKKLPRIIDEVHSLMEMQCWSRIRQPGRWPRSS